MVFTITLTMGELSPVVDDVQPLGLSDRARFESSQPTPPPTPIFPQCSKPPQPLSRLRDCSRLPLTPLAKLRVTQGKTIDTFPTGITLPRGNQLAQILRNHSANAPLACTIETGFALGLLLLFILEASLESSSPDDVHHTAIDPFQRRDWNNTGLRTLRDAGLSHHLRLLEADSALVLPALAAGGESFDAAFVDGSHQFDGVFIDIFYMLRLVRPGGLIILDDYWMPAVRAALSFFTTNLNLSLETYPDEKGRPKLASLRVPTTPPRPPAPGTTTTPFHARLNTCRRLRQIPRFSIYSRPLQSPAAHPYARALR